MEKDKDFLALIEKAESGEDLSDEELAALKALQVEKEAEIARLTGVTTLLSGNDIVMVDDQDNEEDK